MRARLLFALGFVAIVGGLIALRDAGYLGGRAVGGPLRIGTDGASARARPAQVVGFGLDGTLAGGPVRVQNVRPRLVSPELEVLGPNRYAGACGTCDLASWPPGNGPVPLADAELPGPRPRAIIGLHAPRAGTYYAFGLIVDYRRGQRRFRDREAQTLCIVVRTQQRCDLDYDGPGDARVAQVGGPGRYRGARLTATSAQYIRPGEYRLRITLANQTRSAIDVADLALDQNDLGATVTATEPDAFRLPPHGYRVVRLRLSVPPCEPIAITFHRLRADLDGERRSIPLSLPLRVGCQ